MPHLSERQCDQFRNFAIILYSLHHAPVPICHQVLQILLPKYLSYLSLPSIFRHQFPSSLTEWIQEFTCSVWLQSLAHTQKETIYYANYICPLFTTFQCLPLLISGALNPLFTMKPCIVGHSPLPFCSTTGGDPRDKDPCPDVPTSSRVFCLKCPTSSSVCSQTPFPSNANLWLSLWIQSKTGKIKLANQC